MLSYFYERTKSVDIVYFVRLMVVDGELFRFEIHLDPTIQKYVATCDQDFLNQFRFEFKTTDIESEVAAFEAWANEVIAELRKF